MATLVEPDVSPFPNLVIRASAGTGKTFHLSNRYLKLIFEDIPVDQVLATTFTRQAAREILDRILSRIAAAASSIEACDQLAAAIEVEDLTPEKCKRKLAYLTSNLHRLRISTLDAFFIRIAQSISLELGLPPGWQIADETEEDRTRDFAIEALLLNDSTKRVVQLMHLLSKGNAQRSVSELIRTTVVNLHDMYLESDAKAWKRLRKVASVDEEEFDIAVQTIEEYSGLKTSLQKGKTADLERIRLGAWSDFLGTGVAKKVAEGETKYSRCEIPEPLLQAYNTVIKRAVADVMYRTLAQTESRHQLLSRFDEFYQKQKMVTRGLRFNDINRALLQLKDDDFERIAFRMNASIEHLLLDEFQDTSLEQWRVLAPFAQKITAQDGTGSFFCVGDMKQAIYGWRGGDCEILDMMDQQLDRVEEQSLSTSYRSSQVVIDFVNLVNQGIRRHDHLSDGEKRTANQWCDRFPRHETARAELPGYVTIQTSPLIGDADEDAQKDRTFEHTAQLVYEMTRKSPKMEIAVLTRSNTAVAKIIFHLQKLGVPATEVGGNPLTDSAAVQLVLSMLHLIDHPGDRVARFHLANSEWGKSLGMDAGDATRARRLSSEMRRQIFDSGMGETIYRWSQQLRPFCNDREWCRLNQLVDLAFEFQNQIENPSQAGYTSQRRRSLRMTELIDLVRSRKIADPSSNQVSVMTVHQSKGLQFETVFVTELDRRTNKQTPDCVADRPSPFEPLNRVSRYVSKGVLRHFPKEVQDLHTAFEQTSFREELCVLYVALTRAVSGLHLVIDPEKKKGKHLPKSPAGLIRAALEATDLLEPETVVYESGDVDWNLGRADSAASEEPTAKAIPFPVVQLRPTRQIKSGSGLSPSKREGSGRIKLDQRLQLTSSEAMRFGTVMHAWLEQIEWLEQFQSEDGELLRIARLNNMNEDQIKRAMDAFGEVIGRRPIQELLNRQDYLNSDRIKTFGIESSDVQIRNEQPIAARLNDGVVTGYIDRLVVFVDKDEVPVAADIIDFKTDAIQGRNGLQDKVAYYRPQLAAYQESICSMLRLPSDRVKTTLAFVGTGDVVEVS